MQRTTRQVALFTVALLLAGAGCLDARISADDAAGQPKPVEPADPAIYGIDLTSDDLSHWAFRPIEPVAPPVPLHDGQWVANPIDAFVLRKLHEKGLAPSPPADDRAWLRRVFFDLVGLPPKPEEVDAFLNDSSADRRERVVDRLLADPNYGIRWGRRWLDVVRYADTNGYERDGNKPHAWRYRDYVIDSLNADKPFDRFLTEQLAGDELDDHSAETMIATTFLRLGTWDDEPAEPTIDRYDQLDDIVGTVSATFLGMTLRCARCHNHKFEPISQLDYSRMLAIFEPLKRPQKDRADLDVPVGTREELASYAAAAARQESALKALHDELQALDRVVRERYFASGPTKLAREAFDAHKLPESERTSAQRRLVKETKKQLDEELARALTADEKKQRDGFQAAVKAIESAAPDSLPHAYIWREPAGKPPVTQVFRRGSPAAPAGAVEAGFPSVLAACRSPMVAPAAESHTSRRRLSLARWMSDPTNPLVPRVIVNRLWQGHFGEGLVASENDFGVMGSSPSHPELLDWLANELRSSRQASWRLKAIHKLIVLSNTFGQSSEVSLERAKTDADGALLSHFRYRRLEAEGVRDAVLLVSGQLNPRFGGPGVYPKIAREVLEGQSRPGDGWGKFDERESARRSIYVFVKRSLLVPELDLLDFADTNASCEQRPVSTIPTQALTLLNGEFLNREAKHFAERLAREADADPVAQIDRAYRLALSRSPSAEEKAAALAFLERQARRVAEEDQAAPQNPPRNAARVALEALCLVIYNLNEFAYVD
ncbi:MAG TPA: DUF1549 and DUF1553 domain-containing protein [Planctomycetaceae bacterium]|nr:DUF1549 and DUF1553 domain-containing protein [Planctomycetaceae bacterium]